MMVRCGPVFDRFGIGGLGVRVRVRVRGGLEGPGTAVEEGFEILEGDFGGGHEPFTVGVWGTVEFAFVH